MRARRNHIIAALWVGADVVLETDLVIVLNLHDGIINLHDGIIIQTHLYQTGHVRIVNFLVHVGLAVGLLSQVRRRSDRQSLWRQSVAVSLARKTPCAKSGPRFLASGQLRGLGS